ncbi:hypothetical protein KFL_000520050 [Klebsormidium nitens]|uniref:DUF1343 domain-containing protein n=1 Tax=Klebsormidium nitens TaxID=105231 RepID=A0A1Y1HUX5_KLENI|nr:hypothetical protein KFL_000520050 [Klebsormidium nitens]|eukprot:GAQ80336.1 hypothetical protein KFL_000520050 [Klebsormidium nitens]
MGNSHPPGAGNDVPPRVRPGIEMMEENAWDQLRGHKVGVLTNASGVFPDLRHLVDVLHEAPGVNLRAVFGPEHGFRGAAQAGASQSKYTDARTGLPVYDLYQKNSRRISETFAEAGVDCLLFDMQDVGVRFYTYIWTLYDCLVAAALASEPIKFIVADRPNPIGGVLVDGPLMEKEFASFVGRKAIPLLHGCTMGELAQLFNEEFVPGDAGGRQANLEVVKMDQWSRATCFSETGLPWVPPSPGMPTPATALVYGGTGLFEGTNLSEGRGTTLPFEQIGAPWVDFRFSREARAAGWPGVLFREAYFTPTSSKHAGKMCGGVQLYVQQPQEYNSLRVGLNLLLLLKQLYPTHFAWRCDGGSYWLDKLVGNSHVRQMLDRGESVDQIAASWHDDLTWFAILRQKHTLYQK